MTVCKYPLGKEKVQSIKICCEAINRFMSKSLNHKICLCKI